ncbi:Prostatic acid phosphatase [Porphyridium purpureum]|uniref:Prostatic acid phosphatase n=1 Tax=Porphyridium purpureum TaxID=35688 RepID=A0A5J4Z9E4_PORPP|nr:Prostatic acid phosphatase [Porphyridium purpureum]|eukprot:POR5464..scf295_1
MRAGTRARASMASCRPRSLSVMARLFLMAVAVVAALAALWVDAKIIKLVTLARHGSRAPNQPVTLLCPNNPNIYRYSAPFGELTVLGMRQARDLGKHLRRIYVGDRKWLPEHYGELNKNFSGFYGVFWSDSATRCLQTSIAFGQGLFPPQPVTSHDSFDPHEDFTGPLPLPVHSTFKKQDNLFVAPKADCRPLRDEDNRKFVLGPGAQIMRENRALIRYISDICGFDLMQLSPEDRVTHIKEVADLLDFDNEQGFKPMPGLTPEVFERTRSLAHELLMRRLYDTDRKVTYWAGGFTQRLVSDLWKGVKQDREGAGIMPLYTSYNAHRELLYAMIELLNWHFDLDGQPKFQHTTQLPPGTTMFFELHRRESTLADGRLKRKQVPHAYYMKQFLWTPQHGRVEIKMHGCSHALNCSLGDFFGSIHEHIQRTGTFQEICHVGENKTLTEQECLAKSFSEAKEAELTSEKLRSLLSFNSDDTMLQSPMARSAIPQMPLAGSDDAPTVDRFPAWLHFGSGILCGLAVGFCGILLKARLPPMSGRAHVRDTYRAIE